MSSKITIWNGEWWICNPELENNPKELKKLPNLKQRANTYRAQIRPLSDFFGIK
jgi:hypothetical protein